MNEYIQYLAGLIPERDSLKLVRNEAEKYYKSHSIDDCFNMGIKLYQSDNFQIQEVGVFLLGYSAHHTASAMSFLKNKVSRHDSWKVQKVLAIKAFGSAIKAARTERKESRKKVSDEMYISPRYLACTWRPQRSEVISMCFYHIALWGGLTTNEAKTCSVPGHVPRIKDALCFATGYLA